MKIINILILALFLTSCKTNIVDRYECLGKEELVSKTFTQCIESSKEEKCSGSNTKSIRQNPIITCEESTKKLLCTPIYKEFKL